MRLTKIAVSVVALVALLATGAIMNRACKSNRGLWWCAPSRAHLSVIPRLNAAQPVRPQG
jgi:hypothetical protein